MTEWEKDAQGMGWGMPTAPKWKRRRIIRHIRAAWHYIQIRRLERKTKLTYTRDRWTAAGIWKGKER